MIRGRLFYVVKHIFSHKSTKKSKKLKKNEKKMKKNLHISKKCCTFALDFGRIPETTPKSNPIRNPKI